uniref:DUF4218 domain-containing protein n=1 Tax=Lactuca sativa TaxID=4236 RepID=A0A9R1WZD6_LACSA|nr:hypothetical protein LSAT_V11C800410700 [Lactuca sativa]
MEHLLIQFPYEQKRVGPVQYCWKYPFEKFIYYIKIYLNQLKKDVKTKAQVEGSIINAYLLREASIFFSHYFESGVPTRNRKLPRNDNE